MNDPNRTVREWTEEDERKYREMIDAPIKRLTDEEFFELSALSPYPPLGAGNVARKTNENEETLTKNEIMAKEIKTNQDLDLNKLAEMQKETREIMENFKQATETPMFGNNENFAQAITEAGIKAAKATHEFNMMEIKAKMLADVTLELIKRSQAPIIPEVVVEMANKLVEQTVGNL